MEITLGTILKAAFALAVLFVLYTFVANFMSMLDNFLTVGSQYR